jgi:response regulator RpfG family c-di-GMP phosphodiesterase/HPt (histidine-containing phosphotransfer) domain-containing protein
MSDVSVGLDRIFRAHKHDFDQRVANVAGAVEAISAGTLDHGLRASAERDAHKLAGSLGTFGLQHGTELARELETMFAAGRSPVDAVEGAHLSECVAALRRELARLDGGESLPAFSTIAAPAAPPVPPHVGGLDDVALRELRRGTFETGLAGTDRAAHHCGMVIVVDDDEAVRDVLVGMLSEVGYEVRGVSSAREARYALENEKISLLLSDVSMPGETGLDLIRFALCEHPGTATLLISALEDPEIAQVAMDFGAYGYLSKPVCRSAVLIGVMTALRRRDVETRERAARLSLEDSLRLRTSALTETLEQLEGAAGRGRVLQGETIHRWAQSAEYRDPGIGRHLKRVGHYCAVMGQKLGLHAESLELASVLHDVGKIAIPESILLKAAPLTAEERLAIEKHPTVGYEMLCGSSSGLLELAAVIAKTHHERFDGGGYPSGLSGAQIPLEGRIVAVADVFDALSSDRAYRQAWSLETTVEWMESERAKHFDPDVLSTFLASMDEIRSVRSLLSQ